MSTDSGWDLDSRRGAAGLRGFWQRVRSGDTFIFLFLLLLVNFTVAVAAGTSVPARLLVGVLSGATPLVALIAAQAPRRWIRVAIGLFVLALAGSLVDVAATGATTSAVATGLLSLLLFVCVPVILLRLLEHESVTGETVAGSLCVYLLIGMAFANLYMTIATAGAPPLAAASSLVGTIERGDFFYFSFISMLTVGFGDIVPVTRAGQALVVLQAVTGQVVLLTLVARMVNSANLQKVQLRRLSQRKERAEGEQPTEQPPA
jgi:hypothetical protein